MVMLDLSIAADTFRFLEIFLHRIDVACCSCMFEKVDRDKNLGRVTLRNGSGASLSSAHPRIGSLHDWSNSCKLHADHSSSAVVAEEAELLLLLSPVAGGGGCSCCCSAESGKIGVC